MKGRKGTRIGTPSGTSFFVPAGSGVWRISEAYTALRRGAWPRWEISVYASENQTESTDTGLASFGGYVVVPGGRSYTAIWQKSVDAGQTWTDVAGSSESLLSLSGLTVADDGSLYRLLATSGLRQSFGDIMTVRFDTATIEFFEQPYDATGEVGQTSMFYASAYGYGTKYFGSFEVTYQWQELIGGTWTNVAGETSDSLGVLVQDGSFIGRSYRAMASAAGGVTLASDSAQIVDYDDYYGY